MSDLLKLGASGRGVPALHQRLTVLGLDVPADEVRDDRFGPGTSAAIEQFQTANGLQVTGSLDEATAGALGLAEHSPSAVTGIVSRPDGAPLAGVVVELVRPGMRDLRPLAGTKSAADGSFSIAWPDGVSGRLAVRAEGADLRDVPAPATPSGDAWIRMTVGGAYRGPARFAVLTAAVAAARGEPARREVLAVDRRVDRTIDLAAIRDATRMRGGDLSRLVLAHQLGAEAQLDPAVFFALLSQGVPASLTSAFDDAEPVAFDDAQVNHALGQVLLLRGESVRDALDRAVADHAVADVDVAGVTAKLHALRIAHLASRPFRVGKTPFRDVLATVLPEPDILHVVGAYASHGTTAAFWETLEQTAGFRPETLASLRFTLKTTVLLRNHLPLLQYAQSLRAAGTIASPADLARLEAAEWGTLLRRVDPAADSLTFTANLRFDTLDARIDHFAQMLARQLERRYPTAAFAGRVAKHGAELALASPAGIASFLDTHRTFSLRRTHIDAFVNENRATGPVVPEVVTDLKKVQRVYKLVRTFDDAKAMLGAGHTSARSVYATGRTRFVETMATAGVTRRAARTIYARASAAHATTLALLGNFNSAMTSVAPAAVAQPASMTALAPLLAGFPDLQSLFGATDYCSCEHCRAIHGPAAYLVDVLEFLRHRAATPGTARDVLFARRPDIAAIELSCANTNGALPYIDLACEVLEDAVAASSATTVRARQTSGSLAELRANPQFVNDGAYATLRDAVFPHAAPFDLWTVEVRAFLRQLGVPWHELLAAFQVPATATTPAQPTDTEIAGEQLGFDRRGITLLTTIAPAQPWLQWGLAEAANSIHDPRKPDDPTAVITGTWLQVLGFVPVFLHRTELRHRELIQLLATRFINPAGAITILETSDDGFAHCDTGTQTITTWTPVALTRCLQFLRLWRRLGCTIWDLDKALCDPSVGNNTARDASIVQLSRLVQLASRLRIPWDELLGLWSPLDRYSYLDVVDDGEQVRPSAYARRFRNSTVTQSSTVFAEDPLALSGLLGAPESVAGISAALRISSDDILRIRAAAGLGTAAAPLDLQNLTTVFRYAVLADALRISVRELVIAIEIAGIDPFTGPVATLAFLAAFDQARGSGFVLYELHYLLHHGSALDSGIAVTDATIAGWVDDLRKALVRLGTGREELVVQKVSDLLPLPPELTRQLLPMTLPNATTTIAALFGDPRLTQRASDGSFVVPSDRAGFAGIFDTFVVLGKLRTVLQRWRVGTPDASWLLDHASEVGWLALFALPANTAAPISISALATLRLNVTMQQTLAAADESRLFDVVLRRNGTRDAVAASLAALLGVDAADVLAIADRFGWTTGAALVTGDTAPRLRDLLPWARKLGADAVATLELVTTDVGPADARRVRQLTKAKYDLDQWYAIAGAIQDGLRDQKRAALVAWLLANPDPSREQHWFNVEELYGFYLIDPETTAGALTTRIKQAAASVQLFVQRCLLQREAGVAVDAAADSGWAEWEWMKRYRLWEANRKIFLYPENWIDPGQRRAKSPFFAELEAELQQTDVTTEAAEDVLLNYLHKLGEVSNLEIAGMCEQIDFGTRLLHVIGRTRKAPHVHYYRRRGSTGVWSPWEKLDLEIDANHVLPVYWNRRLFVFWPEFIQKSLPSTGADRAVPVAGGGTSAAPSLYWEVGLAWAEKRRDRWLPPRKAEHKQLGIINRERYYTLKAPMVGRRLNVELYTGNSHYARWQLASSDSDVVLLHSGLSPELSALEEANQIGALTPPQRNPVLLSSASTRWYFNTLSGGVAGIAGTLSVLEGSPQQDLAMLGRISQPRLMVDHQALQFTSQAPFFVSDPSRTFFVTPSFVSTTVYSRWQPSGTTTFTTQYSPETFYHPFTDTFLQELAFGGVDALYSRRLQLDPDLVRGTPPFDFAAQYLPTPAVRQRAAPEPPYPIETIDYSHDGAYQAYNWELFFHIPLLVATRLADHQRFADALRWFHYIFNPTATTGGSAPQRYWVPRVFHDLTADDYVRQQIEKLLQLVSQGDLELAQKIAEWRAEPFDPHLIAASRPVAYQKAVVMKYIATLIAWGDQLFRGDTIETLNEATQLYLLASQLLGRRPQNLRALEPGAAKTYGELAPILDAFGNATVDIENVISVPPPGGAPAGAPLPQLHTFYFCIPPNEQLLGYWDTVADRLFKIRNGLNLEGIARPLALYEPPIDPGLLVRAAAAGIDLSTVLADIDASQPCYRFTTLWQAAHDLCQDVRTLGGSFLSALERRDGEALARLQATQELALLGKIRAVKDDQLDEAKARRASLLATRTMAVIRRDYYASRDFLNPAELTGLVLGGGAVVSEAAATLLDLLASAAHGVPSITFGGAGFGGSPVAVVTTGGGSVGNAASAAASALRGVSATLGQGASLASTIGSYQRRRDDWDLQRRIADKEIVQLDQEIIAANIRVALCQHEIDAHELQHENAKTVAETLSAKFTSRELYDWFVSQLSTTYFQAYQLTYDLAKRASKAYAFELGTDPGYIQFGYWDSLHKGLLAGDKLLLDLRRLQAERLDRNRRELELTKHVSLLQLDPLALARLRQTGECFINLPESAFDLDQPGHYMRRLKTVAVSLPCVTGPYTTVNATLTLVNHAVRRSAEPAPQYLPPVDADGIPLDSDPRFTRGTGAVQSVALSTGREDAGLFEVNFNDERYLPFEGLGAVSHWRLELPRDTNRWDVTTLSDVVLHLRYTARDGGQTLRDAARAAVVAALPRTGRQLLSARNGFPDAWARLWAPTGSGQELGFALDDRHLPHRAAHHRYRITAIAAIVLFRDDRSYVAYAAGSSLRVHLGFATQDGAPPAATAMFVPEPGVGQIPIASIALAGDVGPITAAFAEADVASVSLLDVAEPAPGGGSHHRLNRDLLDDVLLLVTYQLEDT